MRTTRPRINQNEKGAIETNWHLGGPGSTRKSALVTTCFLIIAVNVSIIWLTLEGNNLMGYRLYWPVGLIEMSVLVGLLSGSRRSEQIAAQPAELQGALSV